jgi:antitoxin MazE
MEVNIMDIAITKWGNSMGLRLPAFITRQLNLHSGDRVHINIIDNKVVIEPIKVNNRDIIRQALANFTPEQLTVVDIDELDSEVWHD